MPKQMDLKLVPLNSAAMRMGSIRETPDGFLLPSNAFLVRERILAATPSVLKAGTIFRTNTPSLIVFAGIETDLEVILHAVASPRETPHAVFEVSRFSTPPLPTLPIWMTCLVTGPSATPRYAA